LSIVKRLWLLFFSKSNVLGVGYLQSTENTRMKTEVQARYGDKCLQSLQEELRRENCELEASLGYKVRSCIKKKKAHTQMCQLICIIAVPHV
jgi:hypothetical protein